jgi:hypothetical protein
MSFARSVSKLETLYIEGLPLQYLLYIGIRYPFPVGGSRKGRIRSMDALPSHKNSYRQPYSHKKSYLKSRRKAHRV